MMNAIEQAAKALPQLSDAEWLRLKRVEERRRSEQRTIRGWPKNFVNSSLYYEK